MCARRATKTYLKNLREEVRVNALQLEELSYFAEFFVLSVGKNSGQNSMVSSNIKLDNPSQDLYRLDAGV